MGIKKIKSCTYVSDTGKEYELSEMAPSHLLNVIAHHNKQMDGLLIALGLVGTTEGNYLPMWRDNLMETINALSFELATRDPNAVVAAPMKRSSYSDHY